MPALRTWAPLVALYVFAVLARLPGLERSFWYDELFTLSHFPTPWSALTEQVAANNHPPASLLAWLAQALGARSEWGIRLPFAALGALAAPAAVWAAGGVRRASALLAGGLVALAPLAVDLSQQVRGYALALPLAAVLPGLWARCHDAPTPRRSALLALATAAGIYAHPTFALVALALLAVSRRRASVVPLGVGAALGVLALAPTLDRTWKFVRANVGLGAEARLTLTDLGSLLGPAWLAVPLAGLAAVGAWRALERGRAQEVAWVAVAAAPLVLWVVRPVGYPRFAAVCLPAWLVLASGGLVGWVGRRLWLGLLGLTVVLGAEAAATRARAGQPWQDVRLGVRLARQAVGEGAVVAEGHEGALLGLYDPGVIAFERAEDVERFTEEFAGPWAYVAPFPQWVSPARRAWLQARCQAPWGVPGHVATVEVWVALPREPAESPQEPTE